MLVGVSDTVLRAVSKTSVGETKILGNGMLTVSNYSQVLLEMFCSSVFKTDRSNVTSSVVTNARRSFRGGIARGLENARL